MSIEQIDALLKKLSEGTKGSYPFADKAKQYRGYSDAGLDYSVKDASDAMKAMKGHDPSAENWYRDDVATIRQEIERRRGKKTKTEDGTAGPHDALAADPDYKSVTPREQNFLQNFLGSATGHNSNDRMNFHNDVKSYGYKNVAKLTKLFAKHYPAFSASAQKGEADGSAPTEKLDALLKELSEVEGGDTVTESLSAKYYVAVAQIIRDSKNKEEIAHALADLFMADNPRFDGVRFMKAAGLHTPEIIDRPSDRSRVAEDGDAGFDAWMKKVDAEVKKISGMAVADLDDAPYHDWYDDDLSPSRAARQAIKNAGG